MPATTWTWALCYSVEHGLPVLPLRPGKKLPATAHGVKDASTDPEQLDRWAAQWPAANLGIAGGGLARLVVIDFDSTEAVDVLTERYGARPATWTATTPRGGRHEYYTVPATITLGNTAGKLAQHVDTRGGAGYVVAPPSVLVDGRRYTWAPGRSPDDLERAELPAPLLEALTAPPSRPTLPFPPPSTRTAHTDDAERRVGRYLATLPPLADGQGRNATAFRLAAFVLHDVRGSEADALVALEVWNGRNMEPLAAAALHRAVRNAARYGGRHHAA